MPRIVFVRHAEPVLDPDEPPGRWPLSEKGAHDATALGRSLDRVLDNPPGQIVASTEVKAIETARQLGFATVETDERFREVSKPWYPAKGDHNDAAVAYLDGRATAGWESQSSVLARFSAGIDAVTAELAFVATHGTVLSLWLAHRLPTIEASAFWLELTMPDAYLFDSDSETCMRLPRS